MGRLRSLHCLGGTGVSPVQAQAEAWGYQILASDFSSVQHGRFDVPWELPGSTVAPVPQLHNQHGHDLSG